MRVTWSLMPGPYRNQVKPPFFVGSCLCLATRIRQPAPSWIGKEGLGVVQRTSPTSSASGGDRVGEIQPIIVGCPPERAATGSATSDIWVHRIVLRGASRLRQGVYAPKGPAKVTPSDTSDIGLQI